MRLFERSGLLFEFLVRGAQFFLLKLHFLVEALRFLERVLQPFAIQRRFNRRSHIAAISFRNSMSRADTGFMNPSSTTPLTVPPFSIGAMTTLFGALVPSPDVTLR